MFSSSLRIISGHLPAAAHLRLASPLAAPLSSHLLLHLRGGSSDAAETKYVTLDNPAPGSREFNIETYSYNFIFLAVMT